jgi:protein SCO1/2
MFNQMRKFSSKDPKGSGSNFGKERTDGKTPPDPTDTSGYYSDEDSTSFTSDRKFSNFILFTGAFALLLIYLYSNVQSIKRKREQKIQNVGKAKYTGKANIGGPWLLYDCEGKAISHKDLEGKYYLIYFGFTMCPDVCPISLNKVAKARRQVMKSKEYKYFDLASVFVSLDPDRDTSERISQYCRIFDEDMMGLTHKTNDDPDLKEILKKFKIHSSKIFLTEEEEKEDEDAMKACAPDVIELMKDKKVKKDDKYSLDHTIVTYLMGPDNDFITYLGSNLNEQEMAGIILDEISADLGRKYKVQ